MQQHVTVAGKRVTVRLTGNMYVEDAAVFREELLEHLAQGRNTIVIEMRELDYIDSSGLGVLVTIHKRALQAGGSVTLSGLRGVVKELFELTRLNKVFEIQAYH